MPHPARVTSRGLLTGRIRTFWTMQMDWGTGRYESSAAQLEAAAWVVVDAAAPGAGERVLDIGCGTGNAALLAAERGARVTGVDPAGRLLGVARERAAAQHLEVTFLPGEAAALPIDDGSVDVALSVFAVIFAPDPARAVAEIARVVRPGGRLVLSAWIPTGAIFEMNRLAFEAVAKAVGAPPGPPPFAWHEKQALAGLLAPHGFDLVVIQEHRLGFVGTSARAYLQAEMENHPMAVSARAAIEAGGGQPPNLFDPMLAILESGNEDREAFQVTSRYVVAVARRR